ncbi:MAG TPA: hypothetical protein VE971_00500 [Candidatus Eisenbacteria bacterium]|nr:hypothetical protein [Candidatus Eisenbacteria bacterium]
MRTIFTLKISALRIRKLSLDIEITHRCGHALAAAEGARSSGHKLMVFQPPGDSCEAHKYQDPFLVWMTKVAEETVHVQLVLRLPK